MTSSALRGDERNRPELPQFLCRGHGWMTMNDEREAVVCLSLVSGVGARLMSRLLSEFGSANNVLKTPSRQLRRVPGVGLSIADKISQASRNYDVAEELNRCIQHGISLCLLGDESYPVMLQKTPDPPHVLYHQGQFDACDAMSMAIVGTRHATRYGERQAIRFAKALVAAGYTVVSGLARGVDAAAHRSALESGGRTIAVLGSGLLQLYPPEHSELAQAIAKNGVVLSEAPPLRQPFSGAFPQRNRIISGLSMGVLVVEAAERSGALITARHALEQGRDVFAIPGRIDQRSSRGCHSLIKDGAKLVESIDDLLDELGPMPEPVTLPSGEQIHHPIELRLNEQEQQVLQTLGNDSILIDELVHRCQLSPAQVLSTLSALEMRSLVVRLGGQRVERR